MTKEQIKKIVRLTESIVNKKLNENGPYNYDDSNIPLRNMNGDSENTILRDYMKVITACDNLIQVIASAESLNHGRNGASPTHRQNLTKFRADQIDSVRQVKQTYEYALAEFQQVNKR
jgi:hypothetical protein